jgi:hypothetical protein
MHVGTGAYRSSLAGNDDSIMHSMAPSVKQGSGIPSNEVDVETMTKSANFHHVSGMPRAPIDPSKVRVEKYVHIGEHEFPGSSSQGNQRRSRSQKRSAVALKVQNVSE